MNRTSNLVGVLAAIACLAPGAPRAAGCLQDGWDNGTILAHTIFPNWTKVNAMSGDLWLFAGSTGTTVQGLTVCNFGTAAKTDLAGVYVVFNCGATTSGTLTLTYAGIFNEDSGALPAWTWSGVTPDFSTCPDLCGNPACGAFFNVNIYADIAACPTPGVTLRLGFPTNNGFAVGSVTDNGGCQAPSGDAAGPVLPIQYLYKTGPDTATPGDTIQFTIYYGRPGTGSLTPIQILDSLPPYTHYLSGTGSPAPDPGWDPDPGPPTRLLWTLPGPFPTTGGPTGMITFSATVDWGNGEAFEPGSGDVAAPEGARLSNRASGTFVGAACSHADSSPAQTVVRRFLMWMVADNDILFSPTYGQPPDEMTYSIFVKNISSTKTWWNVSIWDTVPSLLNPWGPNMGFNDPCSGWTMTPSGCAAAAPGQIVVGGNTILTWRLDMPPGFTLSVQWKAQVSPTAAANSTAVNVMSLQEGGHIGIAGGTGNSGQPAQFAHLAAIILPTTYISYVAYSGDKWAQPGDALTMFPLNKKTQFELRSLDYEGGWAGTGGPSASIGCLIGDCIGGFPGNPGPCPTGAIGSGPTSLSGCKAERIPARYEHPVPAATPYQHLYKLTSNSPVDWQSQPTVGSQCGDFHTYAPAATLSYVGMGHYFWKNSYNATIVGSGTEMFFMNTGKDPYGNYDTTLTTTVHLFQFNYATLSWDYLTSYDIAGESGACWPQTLLGDEGAYRSISSQTQVIAWQGYQCLSTLGCGCPCYNDSTLMPTRETGNTVSQGGPATFYGVAQGYGDGWKVIVGNVGAVDAKYQVFQYVPDVAVGAPGVPVNMVGTSGTWKLMGFQIVPQGFAAAFNPRQYDNDATYFDMSSTGAFKVEVLSGGPIQIFAGARIWTGWGGGSVLHAINGDQTGVEFWINQTTHSGTSGTTPETYAVNVFCPKTAMAVQCIGETGRNQTYTTTGPDQCVAFLGFPSPGTKINFRFFQPAGSASGNMVAQYINAGPEKGYTAPFLQTGVHYSIILPPVVYVGQSFWMTVIVVDQGGGTKKDYCGTTSFTSTDPSAKLEGTGMQAYDYTWASNVGAGCNGGAAIDGIRIFMNVSFNALGIQSIIAIDSADGSISGLGATMVVGADVKLSKAPRLSVAASGDTVRFQVCWSNYSSTSAFSFVMTDGIPVGTTFVPEAGTAAFDCGNTKGQTINTAYSTSTSATPPAGFTDGNPIAGTRWLRWTIPYAAVNTTGCACYRVSVN